MEFKTGGVDSFDTYFGLKKDLERLHGRGVDLVMSDAVRNPFFAASAASHAEELYAA
ncbi:DNA polymerase III subunit beta [Subtercola boreus]|uniref:DNA polymerase III subunit beta n=1 Tax=Subtercola boreus TaxID=120213 RepID=UPI000E2FB77D|nr:DNA polymerase III subunit beta [Subtercola boreus]